ncbi:MAG: hemolysin family protein [Candidatus Eisenbacteria bacterium]
MTELLPALFGFAVLLYLSSAYSGSETAFFSLSPLDLEEFDEKSCVRRLARDPERLLVGILTGNTLVNVAAGSLGALVALRYGEAHGYSPAVTIALEVGVVTFVILVLGEVAPKMYAMQRNKTVARRTAPLISGTLRVFAPLVSGMNAIISSMSGRLSDGERPFVTAEELRTIVAVSGQHGTIEDDERDMIDSVIEFGDTIVRELMVPRVDMGCIEDTAAVADVVQKARELGHSRIPVFHEDIDHIVGVLYVKDLLKIDVADSRSVRLTQLVRPAHYTPESKKAGDLLRELQHRRIHIAVVVDEYGGTAGLVTLEDLIEEIVGDIRDEYDDEYEAPIRVVDRNTVVADGVVRLDELADELGVTLESEDVETLGGYLMEAFGRIPSEGEKMERAGLEFTVESVEEQRVKRVRVARIEDADSAGGGKE